ncbi:MAG: NAD(P)H-dependent oxidoreductase [Candidatus Eremiobacteraeota bacterium]|nr:NAD(P)H-dependent oxidoreductase [Candidatus Eremiobacteraeota bacterium]
MDNKLHIVAFAGSTRKDSFNKKLIRVAAGLAEKAGAQVTLLDLADYPMPLYDGDLESSAGLPEKAGEFKKLLAEADAFIISSAEYNSSISAVLKNSIDWASRPGAVEGSAFDGKTALLISASPGALGGLRGLNHLKDVLTNLGVFINNKQQALPQAHQSFDENGELKSADTLERLKTLVGDFVAHAHKVRG